MDKKRILFLGNGFDLHHGLLTNYSDFLYTVNFIANNQSMDMKTISDVWGSELLQSQSNRIKANWKSFAGILSGVTLGEETTAFLKEKGVSNLWFRYFFESLNKELGWIDFEKEIQAVIDVFGYVLYEENEEDIQYPILINELKYFDFFYKRDIVHSITASIDGCRMMVSHSIKDDYRVAPVYGAKPIAIDDKKIIEDLKKDLLELSEMLKIYLKCFVDNVIDALIKHKKLLHFDMFDDAEKVFTFNYTKLMEKNYPTFRRLLHIHGDIDGKLVLGVNDNEKDELSALDTSFIEFKKYFQRIFYEYEYQYRNEITDMISEQEHMKEEYELWVFGHSLDITDRDIIKELFGLANRIIIFYHKTTAKKDYIRNLVTIYGKKAFDELRIDTNLRFLKIGSEND